jgi:hypothetical protein
MTNSGNDMKTFLIVGLLAALTACGHLDVSASHSAPIKTGGNNSVTIGGGIGR